MPEFASSHLLCFLISSELRWAASYWPLKIANQTEMIQQQHLEDEEKFHKIQLMDQNNFMERLDGLQVLKIQLKHNLS